MIAPRIILEYLIWGSEFKWLYEWGEFPLVGEKTAHGLLGGAICYAACQRLRTTELPAIVGGPGARGLALACVVSTASVGSLPGRRPREVHVDCL
jgi:hypothetical protein